MAWVRVEASVRTHPKFLAAGPAACWLWLCGLAYCQEGLTDGFIPVRALNHLGVQHPTPLKDKLVSVGLWEDVTGGWQIHEYLKHNRSADEVTAIRAKRAAGGAYGGRPKKTFQEPSKVLHVKPSLQKRENPSVAVDGSEPSVVSSSEGESRGETAALERQIAETELRLDVCFLELKRRYPVEAVSDSRMTEDAFLGVFQREHARPAADVWAEMLANLESQQHGAQWAKGMIPGLETWLLKGKWKQRHAAAHGGTSDKTSGNVAALQRFAARHQEPTS